MHGSLAVSYTINSGAWSSHATRVQFSFTSPSLSRSYGNRPTFPLLLSFQAGTNYVIDSMDSMHCFDIFKTILTHLVCLHQYRAERKGSHLAGQFRRLMSI